MYIPTQSGPIEDNTSDLDTALKTVRHHTLDPSSVLSLKPGIEKWYGSIDPDINWFNNLSPSDRKLIHECYDECWKHAQKKKLPKRV